MITYYKAAIVDAAMLSTLAKNIYQEHYLHLWHPGGAAWYMNEYAYSQHKIENDLTNPLVEYFIATDNSIAVGYMKLLLDATCNGDANALEIERIYLHKNVTGRGTGRQLMNRAMQRAKELHKRTIFLKSMDSSTSAITFYQKLGYTICGRLQLPMPEFTLMKEQYRGMVVLSRLVDK